MSRLLARLGVVVTAGLVLMVGGGSAAIAHVTVHADEAVSGGFTEIAFRVPTESDTASTVNLQVAFPADAPIAHVSVLPHPGWTYQVTRSKLPVPVPGGHDGPLTEAVGQIEWTASNPDAAVKPGEYEVFRISAGPLPEADQLVFKVVQTYDDGELVRWIDLPAAGGSEPEHPAPVLRLTASGSSHHGDVASVVSVAPATSPDAGTPATTWWALTASGVALLVALGAVLLSLRPLQRSPLRRKGGDVTAS